MTFALITGGSGGIGLAIARELAKHNYGLLLVARSADKLQEQCTKLTEEFDIQAHYLAIDLTEHHADKKVITWVKDNKWAIGALVNNAGYGLWGEFEKAPYEDVQNLIRINIGTLVGLCTLTIPLLKKKPKAYILNVSSITAYHAIPFMSIYAASKAFVRSFSRGLRLELAHSNISVSCLSPGFTETRFAERANMQDLAERAKNTPVAMSAQQVARIAVKGMFANKAEIIPGAINKLSVTLVGLLPNIIPEKIAKGLYSKKKQP